MKYLNFEDLQRKLLLLINWQNYIMIRARFEALIL